MKKNVIFFILVCLLLVSLPALAETRVINLINGNYRVIFIYPDATAQNVSVVGEFNNWDATKHPLTRHQLTGDLQVGVELERGVHEYKFVVDGKWVLDADNIEQGRSLVYLPLETRNTPFRLSGKLTNEVNQYKPFGGIADILNTLDLRVEGTVVDANKSPQFKYEAEFRALMNDRVENIRLIPWMEVASVDMLTLDNFNLTYFSKYGNISLSQDVDDNNNSYDYLGILEQMTPGFLRKKSINLNDNGIKNTLQFSRKEGRFDAIGAISEYTLRDFSSQYMGYFNAKQEWYDGTLGLSALFYQPVYEMEIAKTAVLFGEYDLTNNLEVRGEVGLVPTGSIIKPKLSGTELVQTGQWRFIFDPKDYNYEPNAITEVYVIGELGTSPMNFWRPLPEYKLTRKGDIWEGVFDVKDGKLYGWRVDNRNVVDRRQPLIVGPKSPVEPLEYAPIFLAEAKYELASKLTSTVGVGGLPEKAYLPLAVDSLASSANSGYYQLYVKNSYKPLSNLNVTLDGKYQVNHDFDPSNAEPRKSIDAMIEWTTPVGGLEYVKSGYQLISQNDWKFKGLNPQLAAEHSTLNAISMEIKSTPLPLTKYLLAKAEVHPEIKILETMGEAELELPIKQISTLKGSITAKTYEFTENGETDLAPDPIVKTDVMYQVEAKVAQLPYVAPYISYVQATYTKDIESILDKPYYGKTANDWERKVTAETKLTLPQVKGFEILGTVEVYDLEDNLNIIIAPEQYKEQVTNPETGIVEEELLDVYSLATVKGSCDLPFGVHAEVSAKYDLTRRQLSAFEYDSLLVTVSKSLSDWTKLSLSFNKLDKDRGENFGRLVLETRF